MQGDLGPKDEHILPTRSRKKHGSHIVIKRDDDDEKDKRKSYFGKTLSGIFTSFTFKNRKDEHFSDLNSRDGLQQQSISLRLKIFEKIINKLTESAIEIEGIFRISADESKLNKIFQTLWEEDPDLNGCSPHELSNLLKLYLRESKEPLVTFSVYEELMSLKGESLMPQNLQILVRKLPRDRYLMLRLLVKLLILMTSKSEVNKMNSDTLSLLLAPAILRSRNNDALDFTMMLQQKKRNAQQASQSPNSSQTSTSAPSTPTSTSTSSTTTSPTDNSKESPNHGQPARAGLSSEDAQRLAQLVKQEQESVAHSKQLVLLFLTHHEYIFPSLEEYDPPQEDSPLLSPFSTTPERKNSGSVSTESTPRTHKTPTGQTGSLIKDSKSKRLSAPPMTLSQLQARVSYNVGANNPDDEISLLEALNSIVPE
jgi:hypothetical protein